MAAERLRGAFADLRLAVGFLTVLPAGGPSPNAPGRAFAWFPLVGAVVGLVAGLPLLLPAPPALRAFLALALWVIVTGALHLDGFADSCDGLLATTTPERRLEILKDPRVGTWAVVGVTLLLLGKFTALQFLGVAESAMAVVVAAAVAGRWAMVLVAVGFPYARSQGLGAWFREGLGRSQAIWATVWALILIVVSAWIQPATLLVLLAPLGAWLFGHWAARRLGGGLTGDVYGAACELTELLILLGAALWLAI